MKILRVWPNPFHSLDHEGRPNSIFPVEPKGNGVTTFDARAFVGARIKTEMTFVPITGTAQASQQKTWFEYEDEPSEVEDSPYYRHAIASGQLFAADETTATAAGIVQGYVNPDELLHRSREDAIEAYERNVPHDDLHEQAPDSLLFFSFGPMKEAVEKRKAAVEAEKAKAAQLTKVDDQLAKEDADAEKKRQEVRATRREDAAKAEKEAANAAASPKQSPMPPGQEPPKTPTKGSTLPPKGDS